MERNGNIYNENPIPRGQIFEWLNHDIAYLADRKEQIAQRMIENANGKRESIVRSNTKSSVNIDGLYFYITRYNPTGIVEEFPGGKIAIMMYDTQGNEVITSL